MRLAKGGHSTYGFTVGILELDHNFPRVPGDIANASSFGYPVRYRTVRGVDYHRLVLNRDPTLLQPFTEAAKELEAEGVRAITTSCGFMALFQKELAQAVSVPVFTSSLMIVPLVSRILGPKKRVGIMTVNSAALGEAVFSGVGWSSKDYPVEVVGMEDEPLFTKVIAEDRLEFDVDQMEADLVRVATRLVERHRDIGAIVFECTNLPPYAHAVQKAVGLPIFHIFSLIDMVHQSYHWKQPDGFM